MTGVILRAEVKIHLLRTVNAHFGVARLVFFHSLLEDWPVLSVSSRI